MAKKVGWARRKYNDVVAALVLATACALFLGVWLGRGLSIPSPEKSGGSAARAPGVRRAVLVGVDDYAVFPDLKYASADVELIRERLLTLGFERENVVALTTRTGKNDAALLPNLDNIERELAKTLDATGPNDAVFFFFSGHGFQTPEFDGAAPYVGFAPFDAAKKGVVVDFASTFSLSRFFERLAKTEARFKWVVVDACREEIAPSVAATANSTSERRRGGLSGDSTALGLLDAPSGSVILQSCDEGQYSYEDDVLKHGVFTYCLAESLTSKGDINGDGEITLLEAVTRTSTETKRAKPTQTPYFDIEATDVRLIAGIKTDGAKPQVDALTQTSNGTTKTNAPSASRVADRTTPNVANDADARAWDRATQAGERNALTIGDVECAFRWVPPGTFAMGTPDDEPERNADFEIRRETTLTEGFWLMETEATQAFWLAATGANPSEFSKDGARATSVVGIDASEFPVENVSWNDCRDVAERLNAEGCAPPGWKFALPTEAQWERACRAGTTTPFFWGATLNGDAANCDGENYPYGAEPGVSLHRPARVGSYPANPWGFFDMHGNVEEQCADFFEEYSDAPATDPTGPTVGVERVLRGGGWKGRAKYCRSGNRYKVDPNLRSSGNGVRFALIRDGAEPEKEREARSASAPRAKKEENERARLYRLGRALAFGLDGRKIDQAAGFERLKEATDLGSFDAQAELAELYLNGCVGTKADPDEAFDLATDPANEGNPFAQNVLAICYRDGLSSRQDEERSNAYFTDACVGFQTRQNDDVRAATALGERYLNGEGVAKDETAAARLFLKAAEADYVPAMTRLGACFANGVGVEQDFEEATKWFLKAAELNDAVAMLRLGTLYERGSGVALDRSEAAKWYRQAAASGNGDAVSRLAALEEYERREAGNFDAAEPLIDVIAK